MRHGCKLIAVKIAGEPRPGFEPFRLGRHYRINPGQRNAAKDEGRDACRQVHALRQSAGRDRAAIFRLAQRIRQSVAARGVDGACPALAPERLRRTG